MANGVNRVILVGNLGKDVVHKNVGGKDVAEFSVATSESWKDDSGNWQEKTEWHNIVVWGPAAKAAADILRKGSKVFIEGSIRTRKWQDKDGNDRYTTEINCSRWLALDAKRDDGNQGHAPSFDDPI